MTPEQREHWIRNGPFITCRHCGKTVSTNALARAAHEKACPGSHAAREAKERRVRCEALTASLEQCRSRASGTWNGTPVCRRHFNSGRLLTLTVRVPVRE